MPIACPACGRPNSEVATRCLYCTQPIEPRPLDAADPGPGPDSVSRRHLIILKPLAAPGAKEGIIPAFAEAMGWTLYDARVTLETKRHRLLRKMDGAEEALALSAWLEEIGIDTVVVPEANVDALPVVSIRWLRFDEKTMELGLENRDVLRIAYPRLLILVRGDIARQRHHERRMATTTGASRPLTPGLRLHFYEAEAALAAELDPEHFDWSALGRERSFSTPMNFKRLVEETLRRATGAKLDRGFDYEPVVFSPSEDESSLEAVLQVPGTREGSIHDNQAQFRFYSRWRYLVARAESQSPLRGSK